MAVPTYVRLSNWSTPKEISLEDAFWTGAKYNLTTS